MAVVVGRLLAKMALDIGQLTTDIQKAEYQFTKFRTGLMRNMVFAAGSIFTIQAAWQAMNKAAEYEEQSAALNALASKYNTNASTIVSSIQDVTDGLVSMSDAASMGAKALNLGLNPQQVTEFARVAERLSDVTQTSIKEVFETMQTAAATGRTRGLSSQLGIIVDLEGAYSKAARSAGLYSKDGLSEVEKSSIRVNAVMEAAQKKVEGLGDSFLSTKDRIEQLKVQLEDLQIKTGTVFTRLGLTVAGAFNWIAGGIDMAIFGFNKLIQAYANVKSFLTFGNESKVWKKVADEYKSAANSAFVAAGEITSKAAGMFSSAWKTSDEEIRKGMAKTTGTIGESAQKLMDSWMKVKEKIEQKMELAGLTGTAKELKEIEIEVAQIRKEYAALGKDSGVNELLSKYQKMQEAAVMEKQQREINLKFMENINKEAQEIEQSDAKRLQLLKSKNELTLAYITNIEKEGRISPNEAIEKRIESYSELLKQQQSYQKYIEANEGQNTAAWYEQGKAIEDTKAKIVELNESLKQNFDQTAAIKYAAESMSDGMTTYFFDVMEGKATSLGETMRKWATDMSKYLQKVIADMIKTWIVSQILRGVAAGGGSGAIDASGGSGRSMGPEAHTGGWVDYSGVKRFHSGGLAYDEKPAILQTGEGILSRKGMANLANLNTGGGSNQSPDVTVNVINNSSQPVNAKKGEMKFDIKGMVQTIILEDLQSNGPVRNALGAR